MAGWNDRSYSFDRNLVLSDGVAAITASGYAQDSGADAILDLGGNQGVSVTLPTINDASSIKYQVQRAEGVAVIDITAIDISSNDERYVLQIQGCNSADFASSVAVLAALPVGKGSAGTPTTQADTVVGRAELPFVNELFGVKYEWIKLYVVAAGTTPSITFKAFVGVLMEP